MNTFALIRHKTHQLLPPVCEASGVSQLVFTLQRRALAGGHIRGIFYHHTTKADAKTFETHLQFLSSRFVNATYEDLTALLQTGIWHKELPGLIISFDDGMFSNFSVAAPVLEKYGFTGWFFAPVDFVACAASAQVEFARQHRMLESWQGYDLSEDGRLAMSWRELRELVDRGHVVGCHTRTHRRMAPDLSDDVLRYEIISGKAAMEAALGYSCECFCWVGGEEPTYTAAAGNVIREAGYRYSFTTMASPITRESDPYCLERVGLQADWSVAQLAFEISGIQDFLYSGRRRRVKRLITAQAGTAYAKTYAQ